MASLKDPEKWRWAGAAAALCVATACGATAPTTGSDAAIDAAAAADVAADLADDVSTTACPGHAGCACAADSDCDDPCATGQTCSNGACTAGSPVCDDSNVCTDDLCDKTGTCSHSPHDGFCEDGDPCTVADTCAAGACVPGKARACDDKNDCTNDVCEAGIGCVYLATDATCVDETVCAFAGNCHLGQCVDGVAKPCNDGSPCTWDSCMPETGCTSWTVPLASPCTNTSHGDHCWLAVPATLTWADAREVCHTWGGELAATRSLPDDSFARALATASCGAENAWIGLTDHAQEGHWRWLDNGHGSFANWADGQPDNAGGSKTNDGEDFGVMDPSGAWADASGTTTEPCFVCARPLAIGCDDPTTCKAGAQCEQGACLPATTTESCDDGNACTADACTLGNGCSHNGIADGSSCGVGTCTGGICTATSVAGEALASCAAILAASATTPTDGFYTIDPDGSGPIAAFQTFCAMHGDGGGWTLAMAIDGGDTQFAYGGDAWTKPVIIGNASASSAVLPSAWALPITAVRVGMHTATDPTWRWLTLPVQAASLQGIFIDGKAVSTEAGLPAWEALLADGSQQQHCQIEGFNVVSNGTSLRIGIQGNNENDCDTVDSWIGVGATSTACGLTGKPVAGDVACYGGDNGDRATQILAGIFVR